MPGSVFRSQSAFITRDDVVIQTPIALDFRTLQKTASVCKFRPVMDVASVLPLWLMKVRLSRMYTVDLIIAKEQSSHVCNQNNAWRSLQWICDGLTGGASDLLLMSLFVIGLSCVQLSAAWDLDSKAKGAVRQRKLGWRRAWWRRWPRGCSDIEK